MPTRRAELRQALLLLVSAAATAGATLAVAAPAHVATPLAPAGPEAWQGLVGSRPRVSLGRRAIVVLRTPSLADRVRAHPRATPTQERLWTQDEQSAQQALLARLAARGVMLHPDVTLTRVLDAFSATVDPSAVPVVERDPDVAGVYPVRVAYPAALSSATAGAAVPGASLSTAGLDGRGVRIALLDTGVDPAVPYLHGRVRPGIDVVGGDPGALAAASPEDPAQLERHGTEMAGLVVGAGGPGGAAGVAPGASVLPIRVAGWQPDTLGHFAVYARSDQLLAGLDRAVDPNGDGDAHDAARIALVALAEPFAAFADGPEAQAAAGALALGTLVVAPSGNDGPAAAAFGDVAGPGAAAAALSVAALDTRATTAQARLVVRIGLRTVLDATEPLAGTVAPAHRLQLELAAPRRASSPDLAGFFTSDGDALVAGRAALVPAGVSPGLAAERAAAAGAAAVLLYGDSGLPAGGIGLDALAPVPVVPLSTTAAHAVLVALAHGARATVAIAAAGRAPNAAAGRVAAFSSVGLAFDGRVKPDVVAPGVGLVTADPGVAADGSPRFVTVNGSSAAAAQAAGAAALVLERRPKLAAGALRGALVAGARPVAGTGATVQGAGSVDVGRALRAVVVASPATLALVRGVGTVIVENLSRRPVRLAFSSGADATVQPERATVRPGAGVRVRLRLQRPAGAAGALVARAGMHELRIPWVLPPARATVPLVEHVRLSARSFSASDSAPALLTFDAGRVLRVGGKAELRPLSRLDVELARANGTTLGVLARLRDVLPGRYTFGLTGRGPGGAALAPGTYVVSVVAYPVDGGRATRRNLRFTLR